MECIVNVCEKGEIVWFPTHQEPGYKASETSTVYLTMMMTPMNRLVKIK